MSTDTALSTRTRILVVLISVLALMFDGMEMGLMPVASPKIIKGILGSSCTKENIRSGLPR